MTRWIYFGIGLVTGTFLLSLSIGATAKPGDDLRVYENLSEIQIPKQEALKFDSEIESLSAKESNFKEVLVVKGKKAKIKLKNVHSRR